MHTITRDAVGPTAKQSLTSAQYRLLYLSNSEQIGGGNRSLLILADGMRQRGHHPLLICPHAGPMVDHCHEARFRCLVRPYVQPSWRNPWETYLECKKWSSLIRDERIELIHANDCTNARVLALAAWRQDIPLVCHIRFPPKVEAIEWMFRRMPAPKVLVFNSRALQTEVGPAFESHYPQIEQTVIHNAVSVDQFYPQQVPDSGTFRVGMIANLLPIKGHGDFLRMASLLLARGIRAEFWMIGGDIHHSGYGRHLIDRAKELGVEDRVRFLGHCPNVGELINSLDVVVCPSHVEPFGLCLIEGMACAKPVVATRVGGIPEVVDDGVTGLLVEPRAPEQLADAVESLADDTYLRLAMGEAGRDRVLQKFAPECVLKKTTDIYKKLI